MNLKKRLFSVARFSIVSYLLICAAMFMLQRRLLYFPTPFDPSTNSSDVEFPVDGAVLKIARHEDEGERAVIYFGGNGENVSYSLQGYVKSFPGHAIYMMHYRGYSGSTGSPSESAIRADADKLFAMVQSKHPKVTLVGRSLGTGVAIRLAADHSVERLVLVTPYDSILNVAKESYWWLPVSWLLLDRFESWKDAPRVQAPTLILAAENDEVISPQRTQNLGEHFSKELLTYTTLPNVGHNSISRDPSYWNLIAGERTVESAKEGKL